MYTLVAYGAISLVWFRSNGHPGSVLLSAGALQRGESGYAGGDTDEAPGARPTLQVSRHHRVNIRMYARGEWGDDPLSANVGEQIFFQSSKTQKICEKTASSKPYFVIKCSKTWGAPRFLVMTAKVGVFFFTPDLMYI